MTADELLPINLAQPSNALIAFAIATLIVALRYLLIAVPAYWWFWQRQQASPSQQLHDQRLPPGQIRAELSWSMIACVIFGAAAVVLGFLWQQGYSQIYSEVFANAQAVQETQAVERWLAIAYLPLSFVLYALCHELYYYVSHRWMHRPSVYRKVHAVHHASRKTSPFASFSFHPYEAVIQAAFIPLMVLILPIHPAILLAYLTFMTLTAVSNHLGVELISNRAITRHFISGRHHDLHHRYMNVHFGLYFTASDKWFGTELPPKGQHKPSYNHPSPQRSQVPPRPAKALTAYPAAPNQGEKQA